jgi:hypothetical protein
LLLRPAGARPSRRCPRPNWKIKSPPRVDSEPKPPRTLPIRHLKPSRTVAHRAFPQCFKHNDSLTAVSFVTLEAQARTVLI